MTRKEKVYAFINNDLYVPLMEKELFTVLDVPKEDENEFKSVLEELQKDGLIVKSKKGRFLKSQDMGLIIGKYSGNDRGFGFVSVEGKDEDYFITNENTGGAMNGDKVVIKVIPAKTEGRRTEAQVIRVVEHTNTQLICTFVKDFRKSYAIPDTKKIWQYIMINPADTMGAEKGQKVVVEITKYPKESKDAQGRIVEILGWANSPKTTMLSVMRTFSLPDDFEPAVMAETEIIPTTISEADLKGRRDMRGELIITIDGEDARDLDDAVSVKPKSNGNWLLSVHIADVSNYVKAGSNIDREAIKRGTSVYLAGGVIPMLPPRLSNGICSLNEAQDRLTLSIDMEVTPKGEIISHELYKGVIKTAHRMTYTNVTKILEYNKRLQKEYSDIVPMLRDMRKLAKILRNKRMDEGSIDFNFPEPKLIYDDEGKVIDIQKYEYTISNIIIEEFMLAANRTIAERYFWLNLPFVYRVHEQPSDEKMVELMRLLRIFGQTIKGRIDEIHPKALQQVLENIRGEQYERVIGTVMLRSMMKARYSTENLGHFGLAAKYYCHFTSPIRRLADLAIHRIIKANLDGTIDDSTIEKFTEFAALAAENASDREVVAEEAERMSVKLKVAEYMHQFIGKEFEGIISSIVASAFYVELENTVEGRVGLADIEDDYYEFIPGSYSLRGEKTGRTFNIGDKIRVLLDAVNRTTGDIDFIPVSEAENEIFREND